MKSRWQLKDLIDLEYFLHLDTQNLQPGELNTRDRRIYLNDIEPQAEKGKVLSRRDVIRMWLAHRREMALAPRSDQPFAPGPAFVETFRLIQYGLLVVGTLFGIALALSLLTYTGTAPLNVAVFFGLTVMVQLFFLLIFAICMLIRLIQPQLVYSGVIYSILSRLFIALIKKLKIRFFASLSASKRQGLIAVLGILQGKRQVYRSLFYWPIFTAIQLFGIGFNIGILGATLLRVVGTDMAFGWQSTLQVGASAVYAIVQWLALPWATIVGSEWAHPTLAQIEGSRLILKDGIYTLATPDLVAWWPFLCFAVFCYGLLPRLLLYICGVSIEHRILHKIDFNHAACDQLMDRMTIPRVRVRTTDNTRPGAPPIPIQEDPIVPPSPWEAQKKFVVLIPEDIVDSFSTKELKAVIDSTVGGEIIEILKLSEKDRNGLSKLGPIGTNVASNGWSHLLLIQEAWQPPIVEDMAFIRSLRQQIGRGTPILIGLIGRPQGNTIFTRPSSVNRNTWQTHLASMGDPYLSLEELAR